MAVLSLNIHRDEWLTMNDEKIADRLNRLRAELRRAGLTGFIVPRADAHQSEVCAPRDNCLEYVSGFTGSAGLALVLQDEALIFVDGRYQLQVGNEVDPGLYQVRHLYDAPIDRYLAEVASPDWRIGFDPMLINSDLHAKLQAAAFLVGASLVPVREDPFDAIWPDRPAMPLGGARAMPPFIAGEGSLSKRRRAAALVTASGADILVETLPDNIAWLLNVRGSDVPMNPVPHSFLILDAMGGVEWFVDRRKLGNDLTQFELDTVSIMEPASFLHRLKETSKGRAASIDPMFAPAAVSMTIEAGSGRIVCQSSPLTTLKAMKNAVELQGYRQCHVEDGAALTNFLAWLAREVPLREASGDPVTELEAEAKLLEFRVERPGFLEASFRSISASGANAALCHYNASPQTDAAIGTRLPYLIDSGGQYVNGTTDVTRTVLLGPANDAVRRTYTAVLKGFLSLIMARMPIGTKGHQLDAFARRPLWDLGLDYDHGTGHGVGHNLLVHEYPHRFAKAANPHGLEPGNIMTIEPGYYEAGEFGLRIENQVEVVEASGGFCRFASLTLAPIDLGAVDLASLTAKEICYLDDYHMRVRTVLAPHVRPEALQFLLEQTSLISER